MKRVLLLLIALSMLFFVSCSGGSGLSSKSYVAPIELTDHEQELVTLMGSDIRFFTFSTSEDYRSIKGWIEVYKAGELVASEDLFSSFTSDGAQTDFTGNIAVIPDTEGFGGWTVTATMGGVRSTHHFSDSNDHDFATMTVPLQEKFTVTPDQDICLLTYLCGKESMAPNDGNYLSENPEVIAEYEYVYMIKCRFSKSPFEIETS